MGSVERTIAVLSRRKNAGQAVLPYAAALAAALLMVAELRVPRYSGPSVTLRSSVRHPKAFSNRGNGRLPHGSSPWATGRTAAERPPSHR